jgi:hypothetical protein
MIKFDMLLLVRAAEYVEESHTKSYHAKEYGQLVEEVEEAVGRHQGRDQAGAGI